MLIDFPESNKEDIKKFKSMMKTKKIKYRENSYQESLSLTVLLPSELSIIEKLSKDILANTFLMSQKDIINFIPDGFRFKMAEEIN